MTALLATLPLSAWPAALGWLLLVSAGAVGCEVCTRAGRLWSGAGLALVAVQAAWVAGTWGVSL